MSEWKKVKIGDFLKQYRNTIYVDDSQQYKQVTISSKSGVKYRCSKIGKEIGRKRQFLIDLKTYPNTVIFTRQGLHEGAIGLAPQEVDGCIVTENMPMFSVDETIVDTFYLKYFLLSPAFSSLISTLTPTGSAQKSIHERDLLPLEISLPDLQTQQKIVCELAKKIEKVELIKSEIESQKNYAKLLRQNILQEAIEGKLTEEWRKENPVVKGNPDFDAEALFEKIQEEKCHTDSELLRNSKKKKVFEPISENEQPFEIPECWKWVRLGELCKFLSRGKSPKYSQLKKYPVFAQKCNLKNGGISLEQSQFLDPNILPKWKEEYKLLNGDVLVNSTGTGTVMRACFFTNDCLENYPFIVPDSHISVIRSVDTIEAKYIYYCCIGDTVQNYWEDNLAGSTNQKELYIGVVGNTLIPLPPLAEQKEIVARVEKHLEAITQLETQIATRETTTKQLMQSILKDAFEEKNR